MPLFKSELSTVSESMPLSASLPFTFTLFSVESSMQPPLESLRGPVYNRLLHNSPVKAAPVLHLFGYTTQPPSSPPLFSPRHQETDQSHPNCMNTVRTRHRYYTVCCHVHGALPYFLVPCQPLHNHMSPFEFAIHLQLKANAFRAKQQSSHSNQDVQKRNRQLIHHVEVVRGKPFYGFHLNQRKHNAEETFKDEADDEVEEQNQNGNSNPMIGAEDEYTLFYKVFVYSPSSISMLASILGSSRGPDGHSWQPYEAHVPFHRQVLVDINAYTHQKRLQQQQDTELCSDVSSDNTHYQKHRTSKICERKGRCGLGIHRGLLRRPRPCAADECVQTSKLNDISTKNATRNLQHDLAPYITYHPVGSVERMTECDWEIDVCVADVVVGGLDHETSTFSAQQTVLRNNVDSSSASNQQMRGAPSFGGSLNNPSIRVMAYQVEAVKAFLERACGMSPAAVAKVVEDTMMTPPPIAQTNNANHAIHEQAQRPTVKNVQNNDSIVCLMKNRVVDIAAAQESDNWHQHSYHMTANQSVPVHHNTELLKAEAAEQEANDKKIPFQNKVDPALSLHHNDSSQSRCTAAQQTKMYPPPWVHLCDLVEPQGNYIFHKEACAKLYHDCNHQHVPVASSVPAEEAVACTFHLLDDLHAACDASDAHSSESNVDVDSNNTPTNNDSEKCNISTDEAQVAAESEDVAECLSQVQWRTYISQRRKLQLDTKQKRQEQENSVLRSKLDNMGQGIRSMCEEKRSLTATVKPMQTPSMKMKAVRSVAFDVSKNSLALKSDDGAQDEEEDSLFYEQQREINTESFSSHHFLSSSNPPQVDLSGGDPTQGVVDSVLRASILRLTQRQHYQQHMPVDEADAAQELDLAEVEFNECERRAKHKHESRSCDLKAYGDANKTYDPDETPLFVDAPSNNLPEPCVKLGDQLLGNEKKFSAEKQHLHEADRSEQQLSPNKSLPIVSRSRVVTVISDETMTPPPVVSSAPLVSGVDFQKMTTRSTNASSVSISTSRPGQFTPVVSSRTSRRSASAESAAAEARKETTKSVPAKRSVMTLATRAKKITTQDSNHDHPKSVHSDEHVITYLKVMGVEVLPYCPSHRKVPTPAAPPNYRSTTDSFASRQAGGEISRTENLYYSDDCPVLACCISKTDSALGSEPQIVLITTLPHIDHKAHPRCSDTHSSNKNEERIVVANETALLTTALQIIKEYDPDVILSWELHKSGLGYLLSRACVYRDLHRLHNKGNSPFIKFDAMGSEYSSGIQWIKQYLGRFSYRAMGKDKHFSKLSDAINTVLDDHDGCQMNRARTQHSEDDDDENVAIQPSSSCSMAAMSCPGGGAGRLAHRGLAAALGEVQSFRRFQGTKLGGSVEGAQQSGIEYNDAVGFAYKHCESQKEHRIRDGSVLNIDQLSTEANKAYEAKITLGDLKRQQGVSEGSGDSRRSSMRPLMGQQLSLPGRVVLSMWRVIRGEDIKAVKSFSISAVSMALFETPFPYYPPPVLAAMAIGRLHHAQDTAEQRNRNMNRVDHSAIDAALNHLVRRSFLVLRIARHLDLFVRTCELSQIYGILFSEVLSRGSQFRVESVLHRYTKPNDYVLISPSKEDVSEQNYQEGVPCVLEPKSGYYVDPVIVLDFRSLYPSIVIAYNLCYSTLLGKVSDQDTIKIGTLAGYRRPAYKKIIQYLIQSSSDEHGKKTTATNLVKEIIFAPNSAQFMPHYARQGILPTMLSEILNTRFLTQRAMKEARKKGDDEAYRVFDAQQTGLKLLANTTYGYTGATFTGRMPCSDVADAIVLLGRQTLERAISTIDSADISSYFESDTALDDDVVVIEKLTQCPAKGMTKKNSKCKKLKVIYGDTDSVFVLTPSGTTKEQAFAIGKYLVDRINATNPAPVTMKLEKVYQPCFMVVKKRYVGYAWEKGGNEAKKPYTCTFDAKGIEAVRRDQCRAVSNIQKHLLRVLFDATLKYLSGYEESQTDVRPPIFATSPVSAGALPDKIVDRLRRTFLAEIAKILNGTMHITDLILWQEIKFNLSAVVGTSFNSLSETQHAEQMLKMIAANPNLPPGARLALRDIVLDPATCPSYGERIPYLITNTGPLKSSQTPLRARTAEDAAGHASRLRNSASAAVLSIRKTPQTPSETCGTESGTTGSMSKAETNHQAARNQSLTGRGAGGRLRDLVVHPSAMLPESLTFSAERILGGQDEQQCLHRHLTINADYYITKHVIPPLQRIFKDCFSLNISSGKGGDVRPHNIDFLLWYEAATGRRVPNVVPDSVLSVSKPPNLHRETFSLCRKRFSLSKQLKHLLFRVDLCNDKDKWCSSFSDLVTNVDEDHADISVDFTQADQTRGLATGCGQSSKRSRGYHDELISQQQRKPLTSKLEAQSDATRRGRTIVIEPLTQLYVRAVAKRRRGRRSASILDSSLTAQPVTAKPSDFQSHSDVIDIVTQLPDVAIAPDAPGQNKIERTITGSCVSSEFSGIADVDRACNNELDMEDIFAEPLQITSRGEINCHDQSNRENINDYRFVLKQVNPSLSKPRIRPLDCNSATFNKASTDMHRQPLRFRRQHQKRQTSAKRGASTTVSAVHHTAATPFIDQFYQLQRCAVCRAASSTVSHSGSSSTAPFIATRAGEPPVCRECLFGRRHPPSHSRSSISQVDVYQSAAVLRVVMHVRRTENQIHRILSERCRPCEVNCCALPTSKACTPFVPIHVLRSCRSLECPTTYELARYDSILRQYHLLWEFFNFFYN